jgi:hypothetical protein
MDAHPERGFICWSSHSHGDIRHVAHLLGVEGEAHDPDKPAPHGAESGNSANSANSAKQESDREHRTQRIQKVLGECISDRGRIAEYLKHRGLSGDIPPMLRFHPALPYHDGQPNPSGYFPAIVAKVLSPTGRW